MEERRGEAVPFDEGMWTLCNERSRNLIEGKNYGELRELYLHMAEYLVKEGKDSFCVLEEAARAQILDHRRRDPASPLEIICAHDACGPCGEQKGRRLLASEALAAMPLPHEGCLHRPLQGGPAYCRCRYVKAEE